MPELAFLDGVRAQSHVLRRLSGPLREELAASAAQAVSILRGAPRIAFVGMGSSYAASLAVVPRLNRAGVPAIAWDAGELLHHGLPGATRDTGLVLVSQSGHSIEIVRLLQVLGENFQGPLVGVTNDPDSPLATSAGGVVPLRAGVEANVATRTYVASVFALNLLVDALLLEEVASSEPVELAAQVIDQVIDGARGEASAWADHLAAAALVVVGRGAGLATAAYAALTTKETTALPIEAMSGGAFRHGPIELAGPSLGLIVVVDDGPTRELMLGAADEVAQLGARTWVIDSGARAGPTVSQGSSLVTSLGIVPEFLAPAVGAVPIQLLAAELAVRRGRRPGTMTTASKVTERE